MIWLALFDAIVASLSLVRHPLHIAGAWLVRALLICALPGFAGAAPTQIIHAPGNLVALDSWKEETNSLLGSTEGFIGLAESPPRQ